MLLEHIQDLGHHLSMMLNHVGIHQDVVHVNHHIALIDEVLENVIHHHLEGGWSLVRLKNMTRGSKRPQVIEKVAFHSSPSLCNGHLHTPHPLSRLWWQCPVAGPVT